MSVTVRKEMVGTRRLELLTSTVSTVRVPILGATCSSLHVPPSSSKYVQDGPTTGWKAGWEFSVNSANGCSGAPTTAERLRAQELVTLTCWPSSQLAQPMGRPALWSKRYKVVAGVLCECHGNSLAVSAIENGKESSPFRCERLGEEGAVGDRYRHS
jgi:hypothetical protein